jgi:hypothetical protein
MTRHRNLHDVIDKILPHIPKEEESLIGELLSAKQSSLVSAPEAVYIHWQRVADTFAGRFGTPPKSGWGFDIMKIWMNEE